MASSATPARRETNLIRSFSRPHLTHIKFHEIRESSFLELAVCAYFLGAENLLTKQAGVDEGLGRTQLADLVGAICNRSERNAHDLIESVEQLAEKYALLENIIDQGAAAADQWLNCEDMQGEGLRRIIEKYKTLTMFDLGIEGVNEAHQASQDELYMAVDQSVGRLRRRALFLVLGLVSLFAIVGLLYFDYWSL